MPDTVAAAGLDPSLATAFSDPAWDRAIEASMMEAAYLCGSTAASPTIAMESASGEAFFGPVLSHRLRSGAAVDLWDAFATLAASGAVYELKRDRMEGLQLP